MKTSRYYINRKKQKLKEKRKELESTQLKAIHQLLPKETIINVCKECGYFFRKRLFTPLVITFHMLQAAVNREGSFQSAWHDIGETGKSDSLSKARKRLPLKIWQRLHRWIIEKIEEEFKADQTWRGHRIIGVDGTCVSMSDEKQLESVFGKCGSKHGKSRFPIARVVFAFTINTMVSIAHEVGSYTTGENTLFSRLYKHLRTGDLIIGDRRYAGAKLYVSYMRRGAEFITRMHQRLKVKSLKVIDVFSKNDLLVELPIPEVYRRKDSTLPANIQVRIIKIESRIRGKKESFWIVTSLLDAKKYPAGEIRLLYKKRWKLEGLIEEIKIGLNANVLRSRTEEGIYKEIYARVMAFNLIHWLILRASLQHHKNAERISVSATLRLTVAYSLKMSTAPIWKIPLLYVKLMEAIAYSEVPYRPGRIEPRLKKRDQKHYSQLRISRTEWRALHATFA